MNLNNTFGTSVRNNRFIDEVGFACSNGRKYCINLMCGVESVILAMFFLLSTCTLTATSPLVIGLLIGNVFSNLFHKSDYLTTFAETCQVRGGLHPNPYWESASYLEAYSNFPNLECYFEAHNVKILAGSFLLPFKRFRFLFCNPSLITLQIYYNFLNKKNKFKNNQRKN